jgi:putative transposase
VATTDGADGVIGIDIVGALMLETTGKWAVARRFMSLETLARVTDNPSVRLPAVAV